MVLSVVEPALSAQIHIHMSVIHTRRYLGYGGFFAGIYFIYHAKPLEALDIKYWARPHAEKELAMEMKMLDKLQVRHMDTV